MWSQKPTVAFPFDVLRNGFNSAVENEPAGRLLKSDWSSKNFSGEANNLEFSTDFVCWLTFKSLTYLLCINNIHYL